MSSFNDFIQTELPKRPFTVDDGFEDQILVRSANSEKPRELIWVDIDYVLDTYNKIQIDNFLLNKSDVGHTHTEANIIDLDKYTTTEVDNLLATKSDTTHNHDTRYPVLDGDDLIPEHYIPVSFNQVQIVDTISDRDDIVSPTNGLEVYVVDASSDPEIGSGGAGYMYYDSNWIRTYNEDELNVSQQWSDILNKPLLYTQSEVDGFLANKSDVGHTHIEANITDLDKYTTTEVDNLLTSKSNTEHTHVEIDITDLDKYTTTEVDNLLLNKSDIGHTHVEANITDLDKYTTTEVDDLLVLKSDNGHIHNDTEITNTSSVSGANVKEAFDNLAQDVALGGKLFVQETAPTIYNTDTLWIQPFEA